MTEDGEKYDGSGGVMIICCHNIDCFRRLYSFDNVLFQFVVFDV